MSSLSRKGALKKPESAANGDGRATGDCRLFRVRSPSPKKNNLSLITGPPKLPPNWLRWKSGALNPGGVGSDAAAAEWSRKKPNAPPWKAFVPDLVVTFTAPEEVQSLERSSLDWLSWNS